ncbi:MAG TPA: hypothetical protein VF545_10950 [Thermoleophilaceae bacterium]|jgi:hypothetical protein
MASTVATSRPTNAAGPACTLDATKREARLHEWQSLRSKALISEGHSEVGSVSIFKADADVKRRMDALIQAENDCCSHLRYNVTEDDARITVVVTSRVEAD